MASIDHEGSARDLSLKIGSAALATLLTEGLQGNLMHSVRNAFCNGLTRIKASLTSNFAAVDRESAGEWEKTSMAEMD